MSSQPQYAALLWYLEDAFSVQSVSTITVPRREAWEYQQGDRVQAKHRGKLFPAEIIRVSDDKVQLAKEAEAVVERIRKEKEANNHAENIQLPESSEDVQVVHVEVIKELKKTQVKKGDSVKRKSCSRNEAQESSQAQEGQEPSRKIPRILEMTDSHTQEATSLGSTQGVQGSLDMTGKCSRCRYQCRCKDISRLKERVRHLEEAFKKLQAEKQKTSAQLVSPVASPMSSPLASPVASPGANLSAVTPSPCAPCEAVNSKVNSLVTSISHLPKTNVQLCVKELAHLVFTEEELRDCSLSGKKSPHSKEIARPPLDNTKVDAFKQAAMKHMPGTEWNQIREKFQNVQKQKRSQKSKST